MKFAFPLLVLLLGAPVFAVPLSVSVVDDKGAPVASADVQFRSFAKKPVGIVLQKTDEKGTTTFDVEPMPNSLWPDFAGRVFVHKNGFGIGDGQLYFKTPLRVALPPTAKVAGTIVDSQGKAISGATISYVTSQKEGGGRSDMLVEGPLLAKMTATSDANGVWKIGDVPAQSTVTVRVFAPERVGTRATVRAGSRVQTTLAPGAQIKGRLVGLDGKPLEGVEVDAQSASNNFQVSGGSTKTGKDGTFVLDGLSSGTFDVKFYSHNDDPFALPPFVVPAFGGVSASVGTPLQLPDARAVEGVVVGGKVVASDTKTPVPGVYVGMHGALNPETSASVSSTITDQNGEWKMRTLPGKMMVYLAGVPREWGSGKDQQRQRPDVGDEGNQNINFEVARLPRTSGRLIDENGKPVKASLTFIGEQTHDGFAATSDDKGDFSVYGPTPGEWKIQPSGAWEIVGASRVQIERDKPLEVRLKTVQLASLEVGVYDDNDNAVEGARITVNVLTGEGESQSMYQRELISDATGRAHIDKLAANQRIELQSVQKEGYDPAPLPRPDRAGQLWSASLSLIKRSGRASGQVLLSTGEVATKAWVAGSGLDARTDEEGRFQLAPLPKGITDVFAWQNNGFALSSSDQTRLELKPVTLEPTSPTKARAILDALAEQTKDQDYYRRDTLETEVGLFEELAPRMKTAPTEREIETLIARFGGDETISDARWFALLRSEKDAEKRLTHTAKWLQLRRTVAIDDDSRAFFAALRGDFAEVEARKPAEFEMWWASQGMFGVAAFAEKIGETKAADDLFARAKTFVERNDAGQSTVHFGGAGEFVAVSPRLVQKAFALMPPDEAYWGILAGNAVPQLARFASLDEVKPFLDQLKNAPKPKPNANGDTFSVESQWQGAVIKSIRLAGKTNPQLALELAQSLPLKGDFGDYDARDVALSEAARFQPPEIAHRLWRESLPRLEAPKAMKFLVEIKSSDEPFARELCETFARNFDARSLDASSSFSRDAPDVPAFAFYEAQFNPARARFRLERGFAHAMQKPEGSNWAPSYAKAMAIFDANRAIGWSGRSTSPINDPSGNFDTRRRIAQWLALDDKSRAKIGFAGAYSQEWDFAR